MSITFDVYLYVVCAITWMSSLWSCSLLLVLFVVQLIASRQDILLVRLTETISDLLKKYSLSNEINLPVLTGFFATRRLLHWWAKVEVGRAL